MTRNSNKVKIQRRLKEITGVIETLNITQGKIFDIIMEDDIRFTDMKLSKIETNFEGYSKDDIITGGIPPITIAITFQANPR